MRPKKLGISLMVGLVAAVVATGCGGSKKPLTAAQLAFKVIDAPSGFVVDPTAGASGQITPQLFSQFGGTAVTSATGFVAGFKQNYVDSGTLEGISVTLLEFTKASQASEYLSRTAHQTLSFADATYRPFSVLAGAVEASGTKTYDGNYVHGVVDTTGRYYFQFVYEDAVTNQVPLEFQQWAQIQWALLQPGAKTKAPPTTVAP
jgi:hypothetical protein